MKTVTWLPNLILLSEYGSSWENYLNALYIFYTEDFIDSKPIFCGQKLAVKKYPLLDEKEATFWHIIQEGEKEEDRIPDLRRCERIRWPKPITEHCTESGIKVWENERHTKRGKETSICIWFEQVEYLIILRKRAGYNLFWTAYQVTKAHRKRKLEKEYQCYLKKQGAP